MSWHNPMGWRKALGWRRKLSRLWQREDGTATIEFVIFVPITLFIFMASMEAGLFMMRHVMLERGVDMVIREFRLGRLVSLTNDQLRQHVCAATPLLQNCEGRLKIWLQPIPSNWQPPSTAVYCADRNGTLTAPRLTGSSDQGESDQIFLIRVCTLEKPIFPTSGIAAQMRADSVTGYYQLYTATFAVSEPR